METLTPKSLLLDLLRVSPQPVPVRELVTIGALFGFEGNAMRVALTRLVARGLVESDERGSYRLEPETTPLARLVDRWRLGDRRMRRWKGEWLCVWHPRGGRRAEQGASHRALTRLGFREGREGLWVRPDNLRAARPAVESDLRHLGLSDEAALFVGSGLPAGLTAAWCRTLWPAAALRATWRRTLARLERSHARLELIPRHEALVESFLVGGEAIRVLALDPLLPDEILDGADRRRLGEATAAYDAAGKSIWSDVLSAPALEAAPAHASAATR